VLERGAALRSRLVRAYMEAAERDALAGRLTEATDDLVAALRIDPSNKVVGERLAQLRPWTTGSARTPSGISGLLGCIRNRKTQPQPAWRYQDGLRTVRGTLWRQSVI